MNVFAVICLADGEEFTKRPGVIMILLGRSCGVARVLGCYALVLWLQVCEAAWIEAACKLAGPRIVSKWHYSSDGFR